MCPGPRLAAPGQHEPDVHLGDHLALAVSWSVLRGAQLLRDVSLTQEEFAFVQRDLHLGDDLFGASTVGDPTAAELGLTFAEWQAHGLAGDGTAPPVVGAVPWWRVAPAAPTRFPAQVQPSTTLPGAVNPTAARARQLGHAVGPSSSLPSWSWAPTSDESHICARSVADRYSRRGSWQHHLTPEGPRGEQLTLLQQQVLDLSHIPAGVGM
jgi:hypothetical protein